MLDANDLYTIADKMVSIYDELNSWAISDMARRIVKMGEHGAETLPGTVLYMKMVAEQSGMHYQSMLKEISKITLVSEDELDKLFKESAVDAIKNDSKVYKKHNIDVAIKSFDDLSDNNKQIVEAMYKRTNEEMNNFTRTTAKASQQQLHESLDKAYSEVSLGYKSYDKAVADAIADVAKSGVTVKYASGYKDSIETSIRRSVTTGINQMAGQVSANHAIDMGAEYMITSSHLGARINEKNKIANHAGWQGKVFKLEGSDATYGNLLEETGFDYKGISSNPLGLHGYNCRHSVFPYFIGDDNPFKQYDSEENKRVYEYNCNIRRMEREKRQSYNAVMAYKSALDECKNSNVGIELQSRLDAAKQIHKEKCENLRNYKNNYANVIKDDIIVVHKSVGAAAKNYPVKLPNSNQHIKLAEGQTIKGVVFAGNGTKHEIRERFRLETVYKVPADKWKKVSGIGYVINDGKQRKAEIHWYEANGERVEMKVKRFLDES